MRKFSRPWLRVALTASVTAVAVPMVLWAGGSSGDENFHLPIPTLWIHSPLPASRLAEPLAKAIATGGDVANILAKMQPDARDTGYLIEERPHAYWIGLSSDEAWVEVMKASGEIVIHDR